MLVRRLCLNIAFLLLVPAATASAAVSGPITGVDAARIETSVSESAAAQVTSGVLPLVQGEKVLTITDLNRKRLQRLQDVARDLKGQRDSLTDFDAYLTWMGGALAGYGKYVEAGSLAAGFAKYLPVPYAGQAGQLTKFISHFALSLSSTSAAVTSYLNSSHYFVTAVENLGQKGEGRESELAMLTFYADQQLSRDLLELQGRLATISDLSGSALSFLLGLQQYLGSTDEYWQKTKSLVSRKEVDRAEKGALAGSIDGLRSRAEAFNTRMKQFDAMVSGTMPRIASLVAFDELRQEMDAKSADAAPLQAVQKN
jgi:hypothetical protein